MTLKRLIFAAVLSLASFAAVPASLAQSIEPAIVQASDLSEDQKAKIKQFIDKHKDGLSEGHAEIKRARSALIAPIQQDPKVSVAFRLEYARVLTPTLRALTRGDRDINAVNALRLAGELATTSGLEILSDSLADKRPSIRFAAVSGFAATFSAIEATSPAIAPAQQAIRALTTLKTSMERETDPQVLEAYIIAFRAGSRVPTAKLAGVRPAAVKALADSVSLLARGVNDASRDAVFRRAVNAAREALIVQGINEPKLERAELEAAAGMAGEILASAHRRLKAGELSDDSDQTKRTRAELVLIVADADSTIQWANTGLSGPTFPSLKLSELIQQSKDAEFQTTVLRVIGPNGLLTASPFGFKDDHFIK